MKVTDEQVERFRDYWKETLGEEISFEKAKAELTDLAQLYYLLGMHEVYRATHPKREES